MHFMAIGNEKGRHLKSLIDLWRTVGRQWTGKQAMNFTLGGLEVISGLRTGKQAKAVDSPTSL